MPFDDEVRPGGVAVVPYLDRWATEAGELTARLGAAIPDAMAIEHIGSTAVPGMAAKDCLDMMIVVEDLDVGDADPTLRTLGYRRRPEPWNNAEEVDGATWPKMVFAPPLGGRAVNIHVRPVASPAVRVALLFRDHLRVNPERTSLWSQLKTEASLQTSDLAGYGRIKFPAWCLLMQLAETWAFGTGWAPLAYDTSGAPVSTPEWPFR